MLFLATTKMRQMRMADPSMLTAHTNGSARSVFWRHRRVVAAPMTTPSRPVTQVIAPKMRLERIWRRVSEPGQQEPPQEHKAGGWPGVYLTCLCCCRSPSCRPQQFFGPSELWPSTEESTYRTHLWQKTPPPMPGRRKRSSGWAQSRWNRFLKKHSCDYLHFSRRKRIRKPATVWGRENKIPSYTPVC